MSHDPVIIDAENALMLYQRGLREGHLFGNSDVTVLVGILETVLDKHAELSIAFEPPDFDEEDVFLDPDYDDEDDDYSFNEDEDETFDEG